MQIFPQYIQQHNTSLYKQPSNPNISSDSTLSTKTHQFSQDQPSQWDCPLKKEMQRPKWRDSTFLKGHLGKLREREREIISICGMFNLPTWMVGCHILKNVGIPAPSGSYGYQYQWIIFRACFFLQGGSPDDVLGIRTPMDSELNSDVKDAKGRPGRDLVTTQRNSCDQRDYLRVTIFWFATKIPSENGPGMGSFSFVIFGPVQGPTVLYIHVVPKKQMGWPLVFGRLFVSGVSGWPKCFFLGEVTKWAKWFEGKISGWMLTDDRTNKNWIQFGREILFKCHPVT